MYYIIDKYVFGHWQSKVRQTIFPSCALKNDVHEGFRKSYHYAVRNVLFCDNILDIIKRYSCLPFGFFRVNYSFLT